MLAAFSTQLYGFINAHARHRETLCEHVGYLKHIISISVFGLSSCSLSRRRTIVPTRFQMFLLLRSNHLNTDSSSFRHSLHSLLTQSRGHRFPGTHNPSIDPAYHEVTGSPEPITPRLDPEFQSEAFPCDCIDRNFTNIHTCHLRVPKTS